MGVKGLLQYAKPAIRRGHIREFRGRSFAVDMSCVIHRALCNADYMDYCEKYLGQMRSKDIILVFDGKAPTEKRDELDARAKASGTSTIPHMIHEAVMNVKEKYKSRYEILQSPGESDAQLAYLASQNPDLIVVTEDSDLIVYGCRTILFKLCPWGWCDIYEKNRLQLPVEWRMFRWACIMAGCDYLRGGIPGIGLIKAMKFFADFKADNTQEMLEKVPNIAEDFKRKFILAENVFLHQKIYDADKNLVPLNPLAVENPLVEENVGCVKENLFGCEKNLDCDKQEKIEGIVYLEHKNKQ